MERLEPGKPFPTIAASAVSGGEVTLPKDIASKYAIVLSYRAHW
jgi:hypothetical protein